MHKKYALALLISLIAHTQDSYADFKEFAETAKQKTKEVGEVTLTKTKEFFDTAKEFTSEKIREAIGHIDNINGVDQDGNTLLMSILATSATYDENLLVETTKLCIERGVNLTIKNNNGDTALTIAQNNNMNKVAEVIKNALVEKATRS